MIEVAALPTPFRGLSPFEATDLDALLFFGRDREREIVLANLLAARLTVLYGPSGVGKSSLLRAGVAHELRRQGLDVVVASSWVDDVAVEEWADQGELYVILDQFEEYFLYHDGRTDLFGREFPEAMARRGGPNFVLSLREDALARLDVFNGRVPGLFANSLRLDRLGRDAARAAIVGPIGRWNERADQDDRIAVEPELVEAVVDEAAADEIEARGGVETPYLQLVMQRLWDEERERGSRTLRLETLRSLGGTERIVREHLERALDALTPGQKDVAANVFRHLVTPSGTKVAHDVGDLADYGAVGEAELAPVLSALGRERILRPVGGDGAAVERYEIFHDVLGSAVLEWRGRRELERERAAAARRHRRVLAVAGAALAALAVVTAVAVFALVQRGHARADARRAHARELTARALTELDGGTEALRDALAAARLEATPATEDVLRKSLIASRLRRVFQGGSGTSRAAYGPGGTVVIAGNDGKVRIFSAATGRMLRALTHQGNVTSVSVVGREVVTASDDGAVHLWNARSGRELRRFPAGGRARAAALSPDSAVVAGAAAGTVRLWSRRSGRLLHSLPHPRPVLRVLFSPDSRRLLTIAHDRIARLFDVGTGRLVRTLPGHAFVADAGFGDAFGLVIVGSTDGVISIWRGNSIRRIVEPTAAITDLAISADGRKLAAASSDGAARLYELPSGRKLGQLVAGTGAVTSVAFSPDARFVVTGSRDRTARLWSADVADAGKLVATLGGAADAVTAVAYAVNGRTALSANADGRTRLWDVKAEPQLRVLGRILGATVGATATAAGKLVLGLGESGESRIWTTRGRMVRVIRGAGAPLSAAAFSPDGRRVVTGDENGVILVADVRGRVERLELPAAVVGAAFTDNGERLVVAGGNGALVLRARTAEVAATLVQGIRVTSVAISPDGSTIATGGSDGSIVTWSAAGRPRLVRHAGSDAIASVHFSSDGQLLVTASRDATARIWRVSDGRLLQTLRGHRAALTSARFSPNGRLVITASEDADARLWAAASGRLLHVLRGHFHTVGDASFSRDGRWIVTQGPTTAGLWPVRSGRLLFYLRGHVGPLTAALWAAPGLVVTAGRDGTIRTYRCALCGRLPQLVRLAEIRLREALPRR